MGSRNSIFVMIGKMTLRKRLRKQQQKNKSKIFYGLWNTKFRPYFWALTQLYAISKYEIRVFSPKMKKNGSWMVSPRCFLHLLGFPMGHNVSCALFKFSVAHPRLRHAGRNITVKCRRGMVNKNVEDHITVLISLRFSKSATYQETS